MTGNDLQERESIFQCTVCRARLLRRGPIQDDDVCPRCGQRGGWVQLGPGGREDRSSWTDELADQIEGQSGTVRWE
ncbi:MAG: hypothetical protein D6761_00330 [Candidatus Dadabacteria bacterium]|nr:MAG: hypothetical protein D6761_00330 [Candidatus Dadabacteria bacterium]